MRATAQMGIGPGSPVSQKETGHKKVSAPRLPPHEIL